ncbi:hypothetical protein METHP14_100015 [Pseudomonas sp. P14-2025]
MDLPVIEKTAEIYFSGEYGCSDLSVS